MMVHNNYEMIIKIRTFEELILDLFSQNKLSGTTHTYIGEEATAVAIMKYVSENDKVFSNHRCHGHFLAYGGPEELLLAEIMSKKSGLCQGRGGSQHIHYKNFYTNGIQGGIVPNAVGMAFADKYKGKNTANTIVFLGDGTLGQGVVYESLNIAAVYDIPVVFVIEDNQYAMSTKRTEAIAGDIKSRIEGFSIKTFEIESTDVDKLSDFFAEVFSFINEERKPICAIVHNYRLGAHSKGDDTRDEKEIELHRKNDPIKLVIDKMGNDEYEKTRKYYEQHFADLVSQLEQEGSITIEPPGQLRITDNISIISTDNNRYIEDIRAAFSERLNKDKNTIIFGEDVRDPYGGAFKATKELSLKYDKQILNMPISEAGMIGIAVGMGINGLLPVVEMMFGDFVTLGFDQLLNHASKYGWVYGGVSIPMILRTPMGAKRGYGPTHSQSLEKFLIGIPGLRILALTLAVSPISFYRKLFCSINEPTVVIENKKMYGQRSWCINDGCYKDFGVKEIDNYGYPSLLFSIDPTNKPDCLIVTYGGMDEESIEAAYELMLSEEIQADVMVITQLSPLPISDIREANPTGVPIITVEEGTKTSGIGAEIISQCVEAGISSKFGRVATADLPIPNGIVLEEQIVPNKKDIIKIIKEVIG